MADYKSTCAFCWSEQGCPLCRPDADVEVRSMPCASCGVPCHPVPSNVDGPWCHGCAEKPVAGMTAPRTGYNRGLRGGDEVND